MKTLALLNIRRLVVLFTAILWAMMGAAAAKSETIVDQITIEWTKPPHNILSWNEMVKNIITLKPGVPFSEQQLNVSLALLKQTKKIKDIKVATRRLGNLAEITLTLTPFNFIKDIVLSGYYPLFEKDLTNAMSIYVGDVFEPDQLAEQIPLIREVFQREGFDTPEITIEPLQDGNDGNYTVLIDIDRGQFLSLASIVITGNRHFSELRLKSKMTVYRYNWMPHIFGRLVKGLIKADMQKLLDFYFSKGFFDCTLSHELKVTQHQAVLEIQINEGPHYDINFIGNADFWDYTLKKDLVLDSKGNANNQGINKSIKKIRKRYIEAGYSAVGVKTKIRPAEADSDEKVIDFIITEGPCTQINAIEVTGNENLTDQAIYDQMLLKSKGFIRKGIFDPAVLEEDLYAVQSLYLKNGYQKVSIELETVYNPDKTEVTVRLKITENPPTMVSQLVFSGLSVLSEARALELVSLKKGKPYRKYMLRNDELALASAIAEKGHIHVTVTAIPEFAENDTRVKVVYRVEEGPLVRLGDVYYFGNFKTKEKILDREIELEKGQPVSLKKLLRSEQNIRNMDIFNSVRYRSLGLLEKNDRINLLVEVEEKKPYYFEWSGGRESDLGFNTNVRLGDRNFMGADKDASIYLGISEIGYRSEATLKEPRLWGTRIFSTSMVYIEKEESFNQDFGVRRYGASQSLQCVLTEHVTAGLAISLEKKKQYPINPDAPQIEDGETHLNRTIATTTPSLQYDSRDNRIRPTKGFLSLVAVDISNSLDYPQDDFLRYQYDLRWYVTPVKRITLACMGRAGYIQPLRSEGTVPKDQLFFLGGIADVRGFEENLLLYNANHDAVGGRNFIVGSMEARIDLKYKFELNLFYDIGKLYNTYDVVAFDKPRSSVGLGLRYITPIGAIGCLYGFNIDPRPDEASGVFHFSFGYTF